jgi:hypothetical protein
MSDNILLIILVILSIYIIYLLYSKEPFWGGVMPVPYLGQPLKKYGRTGIDATTDKPRMFINDNAYPINRCL